MITVAILINGQPILARAAKNKLVKNRRGQTKYIVDDGTVIWHKREDGAVPLAIKMLHTIKKT